MPYRTTVLLRYFDGLPPRVIARRLGVPVKTVHSRIFRALGVMRERLESEHDGDRRAMWVALVGLAGWRDAALGGARVRWFAAAVLGVVVCVFVAWRSQTPAVGGASAAANGGRGSGEAALASSPIVDGSRVPIESRAVAETLGGRVLTATREPIAGAKVEVHEHALHGLELGPLDEDDRVVARAVSGVDGSWRVEARPGHALEVVVRAAGFARREVSDVLAGEEIEVELEPAARLELRVRDEHGAALAGARVELRPLGDLRPFVVGAADEEATWRDGELAPGMWSVRVRSVEGVSDASFDVALRGGAAVARDVTLAAASPFAGTVLAADSHTPIAGAEVSDAPDGAVTTRTDRSGRFVVRGPSANRGTAALHVRAPGFASAERLVAIDDSDAVIELVRGRRLIGAVVDASGQTLAGARVVARAKSANGPGFAFDLRATRTGADGAFELPNLRADLEYALLVRAPGFATEVQRLGTGVDGATQHVELIVVRPGSSISGRVRRADGGALGRARVLVRRLGDSNSDAPPPDDDSTTVTIGVGRSGPARRGGVDLETPATYVTRSRGDGSFRALELAPGRYRVWAITPATQVVASREVDLALGQCLADVDLVLAASGVIAGRVVVASDGDPVPGAWLLLIPEGGGLESRSIPADAEGRFRFEGLVDGRFSIIASFVASTSNGRFVRPFARTELQDIEVGSTNVEVPMARNVVVAGRVVDRDGRALVGALVEASSSVAGDYQARSDVDGRFELDVREGSVLHFAGSWTTRDANPRRLTGVVENVSASGDDVLLTLE
ncbi:MAG: carboxypeptidase regulatory-like domain-containing protein [Planctomycetes bacterium]|nr:carboxypeptidase regulatory-like domain-containing protein [Planctomycetota bacterium]